MRTKFASWLCVVLTFCLVLSACAGSTQSDASAAASGEDTYEIVLIAKTEGIRWFDCIREGVTQFNDEHADVNAYQVGPEGVDAAKQAAMVEDYIARGVDAICIVAIDPESLLPVIKKAKEAGIVVVVNEGAGLAETADFDIEGASFEDRGRLIAEHFAQEMGGKGKWAAAVGSLTMVTHTVMFEAARDYIAENYPEMELVREEPFEDMLDAKVAADVFRELMAAYPDLDGYLSCGLESNQSAAAHLKQTNNLDFVVGGVGMPSGVREYIHEGWSRFGCSSDPVAQGYAIVSLAYKIIKGEEIVDGIDLGSRGFNKMTLSKPGVLVGQGTIIFTKENVDDYDF